MTIKEQLTDIEGLLKKVGSSVCNREQQCQGVSEGIKKFTEKIERLIFGNGELGLKTEVELLKLENTNIKTLRKEDKEEFDCYKKKVKKLSDRVLINSTKMYAYSGAIALIVSLLAIFVPILWQ